jgi:hypothetical protein
MKTKRMTLPAVLLLVLVMASAAMAMASANYRLDWYVQMGGGSGGGAESAGYAANFTVGQTAAGAASSTNYEASLGYWSAFRMDSELYLPVIVRD